MPPNGPAFPLARTNARSNDKTPQYTKPIFRRSNNLGAIIHQTHDHTLTCETKMKMSQTNSNLCRRTNARSWFSGFMQTV